MEKQQKEILAWIMVRNGTLPSYAESFIIHFCLSLQSWFLCGLFTSFFLPSVTSITAPSDSGPGLTLWVVSSCAPGQGCGCRCLRPGKQWSQSRCSLSATARADGAVVSRWAGSVRAPRTNFVGPISGAKDIGGGGRSSVSFLYSQRLHSEAETYFSCGAQPLPFCNSSPPSCQLFHSFPGAAGHRHTLLKPSGERGGGILRAWFEPSTKGPQTLTSLCLYPGGTPASAA